MELQERIEVFTSKVKIYLIDETDEIEINRFCDYWTECSVNGRKFRAEKEKVFDIKRRFATWKRNQQKWFPEKLSQPQQIVSAHEQALKNLGI